MPGLSGTGPRGEGPLTGRGLGWCDPSKVVKMPVREEGVIYGLGRGGLPRGMGRGFGRGMGWYKPTVQSPQPLPSQSSEPALSSIASKLDKIMEKLKI
jgi:hypothetical protein